jgi:hypothetical protein
MWSNEILDPTKCKKDMHFVTLLVTSGVSVVTCSFFSILISHVGRSLRGPPIPYIGATALSWSFSV